VTASSSPDPIERARQRLAWPFAPIAIALVILIGQIRAATDLGLLGLLIGAELALLGLPQVVSIFGLSRGSGDDG
jgi:hypothetical protein